MNDGIVVAFTDRPLVYITSIGVALEFFVVATGRNPERLESLLATLPAEEDRRLWTSWLRGFAMPEDLRTRADALIDAVQPIEDHNLARVAAVHRIDRLAYPLTVVGMIFSVLSLGHLLMSVPSRAADPMLQSKGIRAAVISAILVAAFSLLDLVWTVLAHQAGQMREMNPLGSRLLEDPQWLVTFKILVTLTCCAILLALRARHSARLASWWLCLVCTIVTFRWLMFNSMFVGS